MVPLPVPAPIPRSSSGFHSTFRFKLHPLHHGYRRKRYPLNQWQLLLLVHSLTGTFSVLDEVSVVVFRRLFNTSGCA